MKLIIGLGNPGENYTTTHHNLGFLFLDWFVDHATRTGKNSFSDFTYESKFKGDISTGNLQGEKIIFLKPQTFMNLSGESIQKILQYYKLSPSDIIVIYDDMSMEFGKVRIRQTGSAGGHNGVKSIIQHVGSDWKRIKVGIGFNEKYDVSDWVLSKFTEEELIDLENDIFPEVAKYLNNT